MVAPRQRLLYHLHSHGPSGLSPAEPAVKALVTEGMIEAYEAGVSRVPYQLTGRGKRLAESPASAGGMAPETDSAAARAHLLRGVLAAAKPMPGYPDGYPWFHDVELELMLKEGLIAPVGDSTKRYAPYRLTAKGREAARALP